MENVRILLVDDENDFRQTVAKRLKKRGMDVSRRKPEKNASMCLPKTRWT
jgi:ActR/RegA family two-component response regulator